MGKQLLNPPTNSRDITFSHSPEEVRSLLQKAKEGKLQIPVTSVSAITQEEAEQDPAILYPDVDIANSEMGKSWNAAWGQLKSSFGAGLEWAGLENDIESLQSFGKELKEEGIRQQIANWQEVAEWQGWEDLATEDFWTKKAPQIVPSMLSLLAPSIVAGLAGTVHTEIALSWAFPIAAAEPTPIGEAALGIAGAIGGMVGAAGTSRTLEGLMEAGGVWSEVIDELKANGLSEEEAKQTASKAAAEVFKKNYALTGIDAVQFALGFAPLSKLGQIGKFAQKIPKPARIATALAAGSATEATEEIYQQWISSQAINRARGHKQETWEEFIAKPSTVEAGVLGGIGGLGFESLALVGQYSGSKVKKAVESIQRKGEEAINISDEMNQVIDELSSTGDPLQREDIRKKYRRKIVEDYVMAGKEEVIKKRLQEYLRSKSIDENQYSSMLSEIDSIKQSIDDMGDISLSKKKQVFERIAQKKAIQEQIDFIKEEGKTKNVDADIIKTKIAPFEEKKKEISSEILVLLGNEQEIEKQKKAKEAGKKKFTATKKESVEPEIIPEQETKKKFTATKREPENIEESLDQQTEPPITEQLEEEIPLEQGKLTLRERREKIVNQVIEERRSQGEEYTEIPTEITPTLAGIQEEENRAVIEGSNIQEGDVLDVSLGEPITYTTAGNVTRTDNEPIDILIAGKRIGGLQRTQKEKQVIAELLRGGDNIKAIITDITPSKINFKLIKQESVAEEFSEPSKPKKKFTATKRKEEIDEELKKIDKDLNEIVTEIKKKTSLQSGPPLQSLPEMIKAGSLIARKVILKSEKGVISFSEWAREMIEKFGNAIRPSLREIYNKIEKQEEESVPQRKSKEEALTDFFNELFTKDGKEVGNGGLFSDGDQKVENIINTVRYLYKDAPINETRSVDMIYDLAHDASFNEGNLRGELEKLSSKGEDENTLSLHLEQFSDDELVSLFVSFKNLNSVPFLYASKQNAKNFRLFVSNGRSEELVNLIDVAKKRLADFTNEGYLANKRKYERVRDQKISDFVRANAASTKSIVLNGEKKTADELKAEIYRYDLKFMQHHTGIDWTPFANTYSKDFANYEQFFIQDTFPKAGRQVHNTNTAIYNFLIREYPTLKSFSDNLVIKGKGSQIGALLRAQEKETKKYSANFTNVEGNQKAGMVLSSHLVDDALNIHKAEGKFHNANELVKYYKKKGSGMQLFFLDGIKSGKDGLASGNITPQDFIATMIMGFQDTQNTSKNEYMQVLDQFSDKDQMAMGVVPLYNNKEADQKIAEIRATKTGKKDFPKIEELNRNAKSLERIVEEFSKDGIISPVENIAEFSKIFVKNYAINKFYSDLYFHGLNDNYLKKGFFDYIDQTKRAGSTFSPGQVGNLEIEGGLGKSFNHVTLSDRIETFSVWRHLFENKEITDGASFVSEEFSKKNNVSYGSIYDYHTSLKGIYSEVDPETGERILIKSHAIVLSKKMAQQYPGLMPLYEMMVNNSVDMVTFSSGVKKNNVATTKVTYDKQGRFVKIDKPVIAERSTKSWRIQQDLRHPSELSDKSITRQMLRHFMDFDSMDTVQELFNKATDVRFNRLINNLKESDEDKLRELILSRIADVDRNQDMIEALESGISLKHPHVSSYVQTVIGSLISSEILSIKVNGGIYIEVPVVGMDLKGMRIENGKVELPEALFPIDSGVSLGEEVFVTRVPSSLHHSTHLVKVKGFLPKEMGNAIILDKGSTAIAGTDFDGDTRHIWAKYRDKNDNVIEFEKDPTSPKALVNKAFDLLAAEYKKPENFEKLVNPIDLSKTEKILNKENLFFPNKYTVNGILRAYQNNRDSGKVISIAAKGSAIYSWLKKHNASLRDELQFPVIKDNKVIATKRLKNFLESEEISSTIANNVNHAIDDPKLQNLEYMGMNEINASVYNGLEFLGADEQAVINLFKSSVIKRYVEFYRKVSSQTYKEGKPQNVFRAFAEELQKGSTKKEGYYTSLEKERFKSIDVSSFEKNDVLSQLQTLGYLNRLHKEMFSFFNIGQFISLTEDSPKRFADLYNANNTFEKIQDNKQQIDFGSMYESQYSYPAKLSSQAFQTYTDKNSLLGSEIGKQVISIAERINADLKSNRKSPQHGKVKLPTEYIENITRAFNNLSVVEAISSAAKKEDAKKVSLAFYEKMKGKENAFIDLLEREGNNLILRKDIRGSEIGNIDEVREAFNELPMSVKNAMAVYNAYEYGYSVSTRNGGFSTYFSGKYQKELGEKINKLYSKWNIENEKEAERIYNKLTAIDPYLIQEVKLRRRNVGYGLEIVRPNGTIVPSNQYPKEVRYYAPGDEQYIFRRKGSAKIEDVTTSSAQRLKDQLVKAGKIILDKSGKVVSVKQNSGYPSQLFKDLSAILKDKEKALNEYLRIKDDEGEFKQQFGDWENRIMAEYGRKGYEYQIRKSTPQKDLLNKNTFAWSIKEGNNYTIYFNDNLLSRETLFSDQKDKYVSFEIDSYIQDYKKSRNKEALASMQQYKSDFLKNINTLRDLKLHLIHQELYAIMHTGETITAQSIDENQINSVDEVARIADIKLAKDYFGEPMIYMHAGNSGIKKFIKPGERGYVRNDKYTGEGIYFSRDESQAEKYSGFKNNKPIEGKDIYYSFLRTKKPYYITDDQAQREYKLSDSVHLTPENVSALKKLGYDSVIWDKEDAPKFEMVVFEPQQIEIIGTYNQGIKERSSASIATKDSYYSMDNKASLEKAASVIERESSTDEDAFSDTDDTIDVKEQEIYDKDEKLLKEDPVFASYIMDRIKSLYPDVKIFEDRIDFMKYIEKHVGGGKTVNDFESLGAAYANTIFIDPDKAVQSTPLHELAHLYIDALPDNNVAKKRLFELFNGNEERAVQAVAEAAVKMESINLDKSLLGRFKAILTKLWSDIKKLFGTSKSYEEIMADAMMNNFHRFKGSDFKANIVKYMAKTASVDPGIVKGREEEIRKEIDKELSEISYDDIDNIISGELGNTGENLRDNIYFELYGRLPKKDENGKYLPDTIEEYAKQIDSKININDKRIGERNKNLIEKKYKKYLENFEEKNRLWKDFDTQENFEKQKKRKDFEYKLLNRIHSLEDLDPIAGEDLKRFLISSYVKVQFVKGIKGESKESYNGVKVYTNALYEVMTGKMPSSWLNNQSEFISGKYSLMSPLAVKEKVLQLRQTILNEKYYTVLAKQQDMREEMESLAKKMRDAGGDIKWFTETIGKTDYFLIPGTIKYRNKIDQLSGKSGIKETDEWVRAFFKYHSQHNGTIYSKGIPVPQVDADYSELLKRKYSMWDILKYKATEGVEGKIVEVDEDNPEPASITKDDIVINVPSLGGNITLRDAKFAAIKKGDQGGKLAKIAALKDIENYKRKADQILKNAGNGSMAIDAAGNFILDEQGDKIPLNIGFKKNEFKTLRTDMAAVKYFNNLIFQQEMDEVRPYLTFVSDFMGFSGKENIRKWLKIQDEDILYGKKPQSILGITDKYVQILINFTAWRYLGFNPYGAQFNLMAGITNTYVHLSTGPMIRGVKRLATGIEKDSRLSMGFISSKGIKAMRKFNVVNTSQDAEISITARSVKTVSNIVFSPITSVEYVNHSFSFLGLMTNEEFDAYDNNFELVKGEQAKLYEDRYGKKPSEISQKRINQLNDEARRVNGSYHPLAKRGINKTVEGRAIMMFKNWMPDIVLAHVQREYEDMNGVIRKGILNSTFSEPAWNLVKSIFTGDAKKNWENLSEIDKINLSKFMREFIAIMMFGMIYASFDDDKEKQKTFGRILGDIGFIYDVDNATFLLESPVPVLGTIADGLQAARSTFKVVTGHGERYLRDSKYGQEGDLKAPLQIVNLLPTNKLIKEIFLEEK